MAMNKYIGAEACNLIWPWQEKRNDRLHVDKREPYDLLIYIINHAKGRQAYLKSPMEVA
jgi:hypothetical protein